MSFINEPEILAGEVSRWVFLRIVGGIRVYVWRDVGHNFVPLPKTWYEEEVDTETTKTFRFAKRSDHTGILIKINKAEFYKLPG